MSVELPKRRKTKRWTPTQEELEIAEKLASRGLKPARIAHYLGFFPQQFGEKMTDSVEFAEAINRGYAHGEVHLLEAMHKQATEHGDSYAGIQLLKMRGYSDKPVEETQQQGGNRTIQIIVPQVYKTKEDWVNAVAVEQAERQKTLEEKLTIECKQQGIEVVDVSSEVADLVEVPGLE